MLQFVTENTFYLCNAGIMSGILCHTLLVLCHTMLTAPHPEHAVSYYSHCVITCLFHVILCSVCYIMLMLCHTQLVVCHTLLIVYHNLLTVIPCSQSHLIPHHQVQLWDNGKLRPNNTLLWDKDRCRSIMRRLRLSLLVIWLCICNSVLWDKV